MTDGINTKTVLYPDTANYDREADASEDAYVNIRNDGSMDTNFVWGKLGQNRINAFVKMMEPMAQKQEELKALVFEAKANGDDALVAELEGMLDQIQDKFQEVKDFVQANNGMFKVDPFRLDPSIFEDGMFSGEIDEMMADFELQLRQFDLSSMSERIASAADELGMSAEEFSTQVAADPQVQSVSVAGSTGESGEVSDADQYATDLMSDPDQLVREFESDPEAFFAKVGDMSSEVRQGLMMKLQGEIQEDNQLFGMLTNFMKAMHDTEKAIIANLRV